MRNLSNNIFLNFKSSVLPRTLLGAGALLLVAGCETIDTQGILSGLANLSSAESVPPANIEAALREALIVGTSNAVESTSAQGGYKNNSMIKIPMPAEL